MSRTIPASFVFMHWNAYGLHLVMIGRPKRLYLSGPRGAGIVVLGGENFAISTGSFDETGYFSLDVPTQPGKAIDF